LPIKIQCPHGPSLELTAVGGQRKNSDQVGGQREGRKENGGKWEHRRGESK